MKVERGECGDGDGWCSDFGDTISVNYRLIQSGRIEKKKRDEQILYLRCD